MIILANSLHFFFTAMKRWKFWNHCNECDEFAMKKKTLSSGQFAKNWNFKENHKKGFFLFKIKIFLDQKLWKNPKNSKNQAKIDNAMNFSSSLRWIFIAKIFFTAMNSLLVSQCSSCWHLCEKIWLLKRTNTWTPCQTWKLQVARSSGGGAANVASSVFSKLPSGGAQTLWMVKTTRICPTSVIPSPEIQLTTSNR